MLLDLTELSALLDPARHVRRCTESSLIFLEMVVMAVCGIVPVMVMLSGVYSSAGLSGYYCESSQRPKAECDERERVQQEVSTYEFLAWVLPVSLV